MSTFMIHELLLFFYAFLFGAFLLLLYDIIKILRLVFYPRQPISAIVDLVYWIVIGVWGFLFLYRHNDGIIRGYVFLALFLGIYSYRKMCSRWFVSVGVKIFSVPVHFAGKAIKRLIFRFKRVKIILCRFFRRTKAYFSKNRVEREKRGR